MGLDANHMPWDWLTKVAKPRGRKRKYRVAVNGEPYLIADANNVVQLLSGLRFPDGAVVRVLSPNRRRP